MPNVDGNLDLRDFALLIASAHDLTLDALRSADKESGGDDELFLVAVCASADLEVLCRDNR